MLTPIQYRQILNAIDILSGDVTDDLELVIKELQILFAETKDLNEKIFELALENISEAQRLVGQCQSELIAIKTHYEATNPDADLQQPESPPLHPIMARAIRDLADAIGKEMQINERVRKDTQKSLIMLSGS
jgi:hypothetical protein